MAAETQLIRQIGIHATAETALPSLPDKGNNIDLASAGFTVIGSVDRYGDDANLDEASITWPFIDEWQEVRAPLSLAADDYVMLQRGAQEFEFTCYDVREALYELDSALSIATNTGTFGTTVTPRTMVIEINGKCTFYYPRVYISVMQNEAGAASDGVATATIMVRPTATSTIAGGVQIDWFQEAS